MPDANPPVPAKAPHEYPYRLGVLFVHGIGDQKRGATLVDFGNPLIEWLTARAQQVGAIVTLAKVAGVHLGGQSGRDERPAEALVRIESGGERRDWVFAESWWAESYAMRPFRELAHWAFAVIPWTFGAHFGQRVWRMFRAPKPGGWLVIGWAARLVASLVALFGGVVLSLAILALFSLLLLLGLVPWERLRISIQRLQVRLASSIGDSFVLLAKPIESEAILTRFQDNLAWLARRCDRVAVVAHSQGAAVALRGLSRERPDRVNLLVTFGSGYRKLEELEVLRRNKPLQSGAAYTLVGMIIVLAIIPFVTALPNLPRNAEGLTVTGFVLAYAVVGSALLIAGFWDFVRAAEPATIEKTAAALAAKGVLWKDLYASSDPVPNGPLRNETKLFKPIEVVNYDSIFKDHTTYWNNRDEFVATVADALIEYDEPAILPRLDPDTLAYLKRRRRDRVFLLRASNWVMNLSALVVVLRHRQQWSEVISWIVGKGAQRAAQFVGRVTSVIQAPSSDVWLPTTGWLSLVVGMGVAAKWLWSTYDNAESEHPPPYQYAGERDITFGVAFTAQVMVGCLALRDGSWMGAPMFLTLFAASMLLMLPRFAPKRQLRDKLTAVATASSPERVLRFMKKIWKPILVGFGLYAGYDDLTRWVRRMLSEQFGIADPRWWVAPAISVVLAVSAVAVVAVAIAVIVWRSERRKENHANQHIEN